MTIHGHGVTYWGDSKYFKITVIVHSSVKYTKTIAFYTLNG